MHLKRVKTYAAIFLVGSILIFLAAAVSLDYYVRSNSLMAVNGWLEAELISIQQGNLLSSVAKFQRVLEASKLINGVVVIDLENNHKTLMSIGRSFKFITPNTNENSVQIVRNGILFSHQIFVNLLDAKVAVVFQVSPTILNSLFFIFTGSFLLLFWLFIFLVVNIEKKFSLMHEKNVTKILQDKIDKLAFIDKISAQVAHDIKSPLMALKIGIEKSVNFEDEISCLINNSIARITEIGDELLLARKMIAKESLDIHNPNFILKNGLTKVNLSEVVHKIGEEKREIFSHNPLVKLTYNDIDSNIFVHANKKEIERILSNIIQNSYEAIVKTGEIQIVGRVYGNITSLSIIDNGVGMSSKIIEKIENGITLSNAHNKPRSNGLGLSHAKSYLESIGGKLSIKSSDGQGTLIQLLFQSSASS